MTNIVIPKTPYTTKLSLTIMCIISGLCWYFGNGLIGDFWYLLWIAPMPMLYIAFTNSGRATFITSFTAYLIGRLSWFSYLERVATLVPAIIFTIALPLFFALIVLLARKTAHKTNAWYAIFAFPAFFTTYEYLFIKFAPDGTAASIAYSQMNCLPVIQIASVTGILGITFLITLIPSIIALALFYRNEQAKLKYIIAIGGTIVAAVLLFGILRLNSEPSGSSIKAGMTVLDEDAHNTSDHPNIEKDKATLDNYLLQVPKLAAQGAKVVLFPERALSIDKANETAVITALSNAAKQNHVYLIAGYTNLREVKERNSALVINADGNVILSYNKTHLVNGLETQFTPGNKIGLFKYDGIQAATAICKDMDFQDYIRQYGAGEPSIMFAPAWDFIVDDWLHCRMAILRSVENGFPQVRAAREGRLTINDYYGRVTSEASCSNLRPASLVGEVSLQRTNTFYTRFGDWFGIVNLLTAVFFIVMVIINRNKLL